MAYRSFKDLRKQKRISQKQLASFLGVSIGTISKIENRMIRPNPEHLKRFGEIFQMDPEEIRILLEKPSLDEIHTKYALSAENAQMIETLLHLFSNPSEKQRMNRHQAKLVLKLLMNTRILDLQLNRDIQEHHLFEKRNLLPDSGLDSTLRFQMGFNDFGEEVPQARIKTIHTINWEQEQKKDEEIQGLFLLGLIKAFCFTRLVTYSRKDDRIFILDYLSDLDPDMIKNFYDIADPKEKMLDLIQETVSGFQSLTYIERIFPANTTNKIN